MEQTSLSNFEIDKVMSGINVKYSQFKMDIDLKFKELFDNTIKDMKDFLSKYDDTILIVRIFSSSSHRKKRTRNFKRPSLKSNHSKKNSETKTKLNLISSTKLKSSVNNMNDSNIKAS